MRPFLVVHSPPGEPHGGFQKPLTFPLGGNLTTSYDSEKSLLACKTTKIRKASCLHLYRNEKLITGVKMTGFCQRSGRRPAPIHAISRHVGRVPRPTLSMDGLALMGQTDVRLEVQVLWRAAEEEA